jgi:hypothetical protein
VDELEMFMTEAYDEGVVTEVIRPAAILPESAARAVLVELATLWRRYDRPWDGVDEPGTSELIGTMQVAYGTPTRYDITIYRATITRFGMANGWTVESLCDDALGFGELTLATCPRADLKPPPKPFRFGGVLPA